MEEGTWPLPFTGPGMKERCTPSGVAVTNAYGFQSDTGFDSDLDPHSLVSDFGKFSYSPSRILSLFVCKMGTRTHPCQDGLCKLDGGPVLSTG